MSEISQSEKDYWNNLSDEHYWNLSLMTLRGEQKRQNNWHNVSEAEIQKKTNEIKYAKTNDERKKALGLLR